MFIVVTPSLTMSDDITTTTTMVSTVTRTSTTTSTRTLFNASSLSPASTTGFPLNPARIIDHTNHYSAHQPSLYLYRPSLALAVIFTILYSAAMVYHGHLSIYVPVRSETANKHRCTVPLFVASFLSAVGYLTRCISTQKSYADNLPLYTVSAALILISPIFVCATLYLLLTRLIARCLPSPTVSTPITPRNTTIPTAPRPNLQKFMFLPPLHISILFLTSDSLSLLTQMIGAGIAASNSWRDPQLTQGTHALLAGLALQLATFLFFMLTLHLFCRRVRDSATHGFNLCVRKVVVAVRIAAGFVLVRTLFRLIEFAAGPAGYAVRHEWCLYVFEALPVWVALVVLGWWHPVKWIQESGLGEIAAARQKGEGTVVAAAGVGRGEPGDVQASVVVREPVVGGRTDGHVRRRSRVGIVQ